MMFWSALQAWQAKSIALSLPPHCKTAHGLRFKPTSRALVAPFRFLTPTERHSQSSSIALWCCHNHARYCIVSVHLVIMSFQTIFENLSSGCSDTPIQAARHKQSHSTKSAFNDMKKYYQVITVLSLLVASRLTSPIQAAEPVAVTPPMGWNSYDAWGTSITEAETLANASAMKAKLRAHGWSYLVIDARWYDSVSSFDDRDFNKERAGAKLFADTYGRLLPAPNRFPSAVNGKGFKALADQVHAMGLKFGFHMMRGIPRQAVNAKTPIEGSTYTAAEAGDPGNKCGWCPDMFG